MASFVMVMILTLIIPIDSTISIQNVSIETHGDDTVGLFIYQNLLMSLAVREAMVTKCLSKSFRALDLALLSGLKTRGGYLHTAPIGWISMDGNQLNKTEVIDRNGYGINYEAKNITRAKVSWNITVNHIYFLNFTYNVFRLEYSFSGCGREFFRVRFSDSRHFSEIQQPRCGHR